MTTIVIAALSLLVLVILVLIFTGRMSLFSGGVEDSSKCENYCTSLGRASALFIPKNDPDQCKTTFNGDVIPAINGANKDSLCCCY